MTTIQCLIILVFFSFTGLLIAWFIIKFLFWPAVPLSVGIFKLQGLFPATQKQLAKKAGSFVQSEFISFQRIEEVIADPQLIATLKPRIEVHIDHFLKEKIKVVFPIIAQFMGEKTMNQFKTALLVEIDELLPLLLRDYAAGLKPGLKLDKLVEERINAMQVKQMKHFFYSNAQRQLNLFKLGCTFIGFIMGMLTLLILFLFNM
ncbi:hypothetical protein BH11BAC4_BH11BAC4_14180 [soil metagenome]